MGGNEVTDEGFNWFEKERMTTGKWVEEIHLVE